MNLKILAILTVLFLMISGGTSLASFSQGDKVKQEILLSKTYEICFPEVNLEDTRDFITISMSGSKNINDLNGETSLPVYSKNIVFPPGTKIKKLDVDFVNIQETSIDKKMILGSNRHVKEILGENSENTYQKENVILDQSVFSSSQFFPKQGYDYSIKCGLEDGKSKIFLNLRIYPVRYSSEKNILKSAEKAEIQVFYEETQSNLLSEEDYDMVVISPRRFSLCLQPLVKHKNNQMGIKTVYRSTESIYREFEGRDKAEEIKQFIFWAKENWNISYVLLVGGRVGQLYRWHVPVRYSRVDYHLDGGVLFNETSYLSDLYFADVYRYNESLQGYEFEDWDSNNNDVFGEWTWSYNQSSGEFDIVNKKDEVDLLPDVYVGRLACRNILEVVTMVKKIIRYETQTKDADWFKQMVLVGGDTIAPPEGDYDIFEGEIETNLGATYMEPLGFEFVRLWTSNGNLSGRDDVVNALNQGAGFIYFSGHGNAAAWSTHPPNDNNTLIPGLFVWDAKKLTNRKKLPVCVVGGCHNNQFDVTTMNLFTNPLESLVYGTFIKSCWGWRQVVNRKGGFIACIGNTGLGYGIDGFNCTDETDGWITSHFFEVYANISQDKTPTLGMVHSQTLTDYVSTFPTSEDELHRKTVEQWTLLGDPSLNIGEEQ